jgi:S1-C subfamily serine protease
LNLVDVGILVFALALALIGYGRGLIASALPLAGFVAGAALGARIGPALLDQGAESRYAPLVAVLTGILLGGFLAVALDGVAQALRPRIGSGVVGKLDGVAGAALLAALGLLVAWGFGAVALHTSGRQARDLREAVQESTILAALNDALPPSGPLLHVLRRVDPTPPVRGPDARVAAPEAAIAQDPDVQSAAASTVRVLGTACGLGVAGSGWVADGALVVTNAHVVAGEDDTTVTPNGGSPLDTEVVHYDTLNDLAILRVPGLSLSPLELAPSSPKGAEAAVIGYPENGPLTISPARLGRTGEVTSQDSYGRGPVTRSMTPFRGEVRHGNSGGPVVDASGEVLTTVFAASQDAERREGLGVPNAIVADALQSPLGPTDTGPCAA